MGEPHPYVLVHRNVDASDAGHCHFSPRDEKRGTLNQKTHQLNALTEIPRLQHSPADAEGSAPAVNQPWRCLWRASAQITYTTRRRRTTLQFLQIFFTEARTFMTQLPQRLSLV